MSYVESGLTHITSSYEVGRTSKNVGAYLGLSLEAIKTAIECGSISATGLDTQGFVLHQINDFNNEDEAFTDAELQASTRSRIAELVSSYPQLLSNQKTLYNLFLGNRTNIQHPILQLRRAGITYHQIDELRSNIHNEPVGVVIGFSKEFVKRLNPSDTFKIVRMRASKILIHDIVTIIPLDDESYDFFESIGNQSAHTTVTS